MSSKFQEMGTEIGRLTQEKNAAYGDSFAKSGDILRILFPDGIQPEQYQDALAIVRVVDKLFRIARPSSTRACRTSLAGGAKALALTTSATIRISVRPATCG